FEVQFGAPFDDIADRLVSARGGRLQLIRWLVLPQAQRDAHARNQILLSSCAARRILRADFLDTGISHNFLLSSVIARAFDASFTRATGAAVERAIRFDAVPDDLTTAVITDRGELVNRALEAIKDVPVARRDYLEGQVIFIATDFALSH